MPQVTNTIFKPRNLTMTTNQYQSEVVNAFGVFARIIIETMQYRSKLHQHGIHVCVEMLIDGISVSYRAPEEDKDKEWILLIDVLRVINRILWHSGNFTENVTRTDRYDTHTWVCNGTWDIQWPELNESGAITYDNGGQQQWN